MELKRIISKNIKSKTNSNKKKIRAKININTYQRTQLHFCCVHMPPTNTKRYTHRSKHRHIWWSSVTVQSHMCCLKGFRVVRRWRVSFFFFIIFKYLKLLNSPQTKKKKKHNNKMSLVKVFFLFLILRSIIKNEK
jgi:hypothetical protein